MVIGILLFSTVGMIAERMIFGYDHGLFASVPYTLVIALSILTVMSVRSLLTSSSVINQKILSGSIVVVGWLYVVTNTMLAIYLLVILGVGLLIITIKNNENVGEGEVK